MDLDVPTHDAVQEGQEASEFIEMNETLCEDDGDEEEGDEENGGDDHHNLTNPKALIRYA